MGFVTEKAVSMDIDRFFEKWFLPLGLVITVVASITFSGLWKLALPNRGESAMDVVSRELEDAESGGGSSASAEALDGVVRVSGERVSIKETTKGYEVTITGEVANGTPNDYLALAEVTYGLYDSGGELIVQASGNLDGDIASGSVGSCTATVTLSTSEYEKFAYFKIMSLKGESFSTDAAISEVISIVSEAKANRG